MFPVLSGQVSWAVFWMDRFGVFSRHLYCETKGFEFVHFPLIDETEMMKVACRLMHSFQNATFGLNFSGQGKSSSNSNYGF